MKITFNKELVGIPMWQAEVGNIVEVLDFDGCKSTFKGDICIIAGGDKSGLQPHFV